MEQIISSRIKYHQPYHLTNETGKNEFSDFERLAAATVDGSPDSRFALFCLTVGNYDFIDEVFGKNICADMMAYLSSQIKCHLNSRDIFVRYSRDSFIVLLSCTDRTQILAWLEYFNAHASLCELSESNRFKIDICAGIFEIDYVRPILSVEEMVERASIAIRCAVTSTERFVFFSDEMRDRQLKEHEIIKSVNEAIENGEFRIYLQPQHYLQNGDRIMSAEALVRWIKPNGAVIAPNDFIPVLEKNGLITSLDRHVMELVCQFIHEHINASWYHNITISVNVSKADLFCDDFIDFYTRTKNVYGVPDGLIEIEFTESAVFEDYNKFNIIMKQLEKNGFVCSLDDFGSGNSSLNMLKELPVDVLKMDRLFFVSSANVDEKRNEAVIASVVAMARGLGMKIIAEGIENPQQIDFLRKIGCDVIQGFVYSRPLPPEEFIQYVKNYSPETINETHGSIIRNIASMQYSYETLMAKYQDALRYIDGIVLEIDLEADTFNTISYRERRVDFPMMHGSYSGILALLCEQSIHADYVKQSNDLMSVQALTTAYYRGDNRVGFTLRARSYDNESKRFNETYSTYTINAHFIKNDANSNGFFVNVYICRKGD